MKELLMMNVPGWLGRVAYFTLGLVCGLALSNYLFS